MSPSSVASVGRQLDPLAVLPPTTRAWLEPNPNHEDHMHVRFPAPA